MRETSDNNLRNESRQSNERLAYAKLEHGMLPEISCG